jgi:hypothetical protein
MKVTSYLKDGRVFGIDSNVSSISKPEEWKEETTNPTDPSATHWMLHHPDGSIKFILGLRITIDND